MRSRVRTLIFTAGISAGYSTSFSAGYAAIILLLNGAIAFDLFHTEYTRQLGSIESSFIAFAGYIMRNWGDLTWYPTWYNGIPFHNVYQPGMHVTVAAVGTLFHFTPQHAYHVVAAIAFILGPLTLYWLCVGVTRQPGFAFATGLFYSLISTSTLLVPVIYSEADGPLHSRRLQNLLWYGEGPHILALAILPLVILFLYRAAIDRRAIYFSLAAVALACLVLTNWPGTVGLLMALAAFCLSEVGEKRLSWTRLIGIGMVAYLLACRWIPPSTLALIPGNAQQSDGTHLRVIYLVYAAALVGVLLLLQFTLRRAGVAPFFRFALYFTFIASAVTLARFWLNINLLPQGHRFQLEMELGLAILICYLAKLLLDRLPHRARFAAIALLAICAIPIAWINLTYARDAEAPFDMTQTPEYRMAQAFARLRPGERVFAPGNVSYWMNVWTDTPQVSGCCDQSVPAFEHRLADYTIYSGKNAGARDVEVSLAWLRAYGAGAVGVNNMNRLEPQTPFHNPHKFEGVLPEIWHFQDNAIYDVPRRSHALAHVMARADLVDVAPENGLVTDRLERYIAAMEDSAASPARFTWTSRHSAHISTSAHRGQIVSVQVTFDSGWNAQVNGRAVPVTRDKLGDMVLDPNCDGVCEIDLVYDGGREARIMGVLQLLGVTLAIAAPFLLKQHALFAERPNRSTPAAGAST